MNRFLFVGGAGFLGTHIITRLGLDFSPDKILVLEREGAAVGFLEELGVKVVYGDISSVEQVEECIIKHSVSVVVHMVSTMVPNSTYNDYCVDLERIVQPSLRLIHFCANHNIKFVFFSSGGAVYGEGADRSPFRETDACCPMSYYGLSKMLLEDYIRFESRTNGLRYLIFRPSNPYGPGQPTTGRQGLIAAAIRSALHGDELPIWGDGTSVRDFIYIEDFAEIVAGVLMRDVINRVFNIGSGVGYTVLEVIDQVNKTTGGRLCTRLISGKGNGVRRAVLDTTEMQRVFPIKLTEMSMGILKFYNHLRKSLA